jgi:hypothetical protein
MATIKIKNSVTASSVPANDSLSQGELAVNIADKKLYVGDGGNDPVKIGLTDIVEDTTPQLGGDLDLNSNNITGTGNINITGSGTLTSSLTADRVLLQDSSTFVQANTYTPMATFKNVSTNSSFANVIFFTNNANSTVGTIKSSLYATQYNTSSDYRLKEDIQAVPNATARTLALKPCNFQWIGSSERTDGFIAHELAEQVPEAVAGAKDAVDADGNPEYQGIDQSKLVPLLVKTIQELEARITTLENA